MNYETQEIISKLRKAGERIAMQHAHGSPYDRGSADRFYNRNYSPHWWRPRLQSICRGGVKKKIERIGANV
jgi:hypothetical protein